MRQAVTFTCTCCKAKLTHTTFYLRITAPTVTAVQRYCSVRCFQRWLSVWFQPGPGI